jgi:hypothetical protein
MRPERAASGLEWCMSFLYPAMLVGALGISVPIVIHLLNRYRFKVVDWGAMELLRRAVTMRARKVRLEDLLLLALRCLVILLVALALARPVLAPGGGFRVGKGSDVGAVIAIDASFSMGHKPGEQSRFDFALNRAREIGKTMASGSPVTLVFMGNRADDRTHVKFRNVGFDSGAFETALKEATPLPETLNLDVCLEDLQIMQQELDRPVRELYLITDAQITSWGPLSEKARTLLGQMGNTGPVFYFPVAAENHENVAVTRFERRSGLLRKGTTACYDVEVTNTGARRRENVQASLQLDDTVMDQRVIDRLEPGEAVTVPLFVRFEKLGVSRLTARIGNDELAEDNVRYAVADIRDKARILYVRGSFDHRGSGDADFIRTALVPQPTEALSVDTISAVELPSRKLNDYQMVVLADVPDLLDEQVRGLYYFVKQGGGLIVFVGDNVQPEIYNARFQVQDDNATSTLLPIELGDLQTDATGWSLEPAAHPLARVLTALPTEMTREVLVNRYFRGKLKEGARTALKIAGREDPLVAEKQIGQGRVVVYTTAAERSWTNLVVEPLHLMLLQEIVTYLGQRAHEQPFLVSEPLMIPLPTKEDSPLESARFLQLGGDPQGKAVTTSKKDGLTYAGLLDGADQPGLYEIRTEPPTSPLYLAVNVDARESHVEALSAAALQEAFQGLKVRLVAADNSVEATIQESRFGKQLWKELLVAALLTLLIEALLAQYFTKGKIVARAAEEGQVSSLVVPAVASVPVSAERQLASH